MFQRLIRGKDTSFSHEAFLRAVKNKRPTLLVAKTHKGRLFGGYTDVIWTDDGEDKLASSNSFIYSLYDYFTMKKIRIFKHKLGLLEVSHSKTNIFDLAGTFIQSNGTAVAYLNENYKMVED